MDSFALVELVMREAALFAACGFVLLGASDLAVDLIWIGSWFRRRAAPFPLAAAGTAGPARDLRSRLGRGGGDRRDAGPCSRRLRRRPTISSMSAATPTIRRRSPRSAPPPGRHVRLVIGPAPGPTSKADCLNRLWERMLEDEARRGRRFKAVVLHDAEDVVHSAELGLFDALIERYDLVQLPVVPLIDPKSRFIGGHYIDEFAEAHGKELVVRRRSAPACPRPGSAARSAARRWPPSRRWWERRSILTASPRIMNSAFASTRSGGRRLRSRARRGRPARRDARLFPGDARRGGAQKARWVPGIALAGWDRLGWSGGLAERWMRLRDRQPAAPRWC